MPNLHYYPTWMPEVLQNIIEAYRNIPAEFISHILNDVPRNFFLKDAVVGGEPYEFIINLNHGNQKICFEKQLTWSSFCYLWSRFDQPMGDRPLLLSSYGHNYTDHEVIELVTSPLTSGFHISVKWRPPVLGLLGNSRVSEGFYKKNSAKFKWIGNVLHFLCNYGCSEFVVFF